MDAIGGATNVDSSSKTHHHGKHHKTGESNEAQGAGGANQAQQNPASQAGQVADSTFGNKSDC